MSLTKKDLDQIKYIVENTFDEKLDQKLDEKLTEKFRFVPTKELFLEKMDKLMGEVKVTRTSCRRPHRNKR